MCGPSAETRSTTAPPPWSGPSQVAGPTSRSSLSTTCGSSSESAFTRKTWSQSPSQLQVRSGLRKSRSFPSGSQAAPWVRHCARGPASSGPPVRPPVRPSVHRSRGPSGPVAVYAIRSRVAGPSTGFHTGSVPAPSAGSETRVAGPPRSGRT